MGKDVSSLVVVECGSVEYSMKWINTLERFVDTINESETHGHSMPTEVQVNISEAFTETVDGHILTSVKLESRAEEIYYLIYATTGRQFAVLSNSTDRPDEMLLQFGNSFNSPVLSEDFDVFNKSIMDYKDYTIEKFIEVLKSPK